MAETDHPRVAVPRAEGSIHGSEAAPDAGGARVLLGLGANLGRPVEQLRAAVELLAGRLDRLAVSSLYRSAPVGYTDQPDFFNLVCSGTTALPPTALLAEAQRIERLYGRVRRFPNAPRTLDIDLLAYDDRLLDGPELVLPHPRLAERAFVLVPLLEVEPRWRHPRRGLTPAELLRMVRPHARVERVGLLFDR
jgi:2-amino-4-hydroxy-6-hydroxymethyldihydropteridine diphosphokinase